MQKNINDILYLYHSNQTYDEMKNRKVLQPFSKNICEFLFLLSQELMKNKEARQYPDVVTFGFFCRRSNILNLKKKYEKEIIDRIGRGLTFHIAPSNVPINFAYTMVMGLLSGNTCIVRASSKDFPQTRIICNIIKKILEKNEDELKHYISIVMYPRKSEATSYFSSIADVRIIWGGDNSIKEIRKNPLSPRSFDISFADRYSFCIISAKAILDLKEMNTIVQNFYNDTYLYDQNACSSPRLLVWIGETKEVEQAKQKFWTAIHEFILEKYKIEAIIAVDKLTMSYCCAIDYEDVVIEASNDNLINRIEIKALDKNILNYQCPGGSFLEYTDKNLNTLQDIITEKYQTLSYYGIPAEQLQNWVIQNGLKGIDRIVPIGKTADFQTIWDGYNLILTLSRVCYKE